MTSIVVVRRPRVNNGARDTGNPAAFRKVSARVFGCGFGPCDCQGSETSYTRKGKGKAFPVYGTKTYRGSYS